MKGVNVTVRLDEDIKREFDSFCDNVGINITTAFNMFIRATLRTRELPFSVSDVRPTSSNAILGRGIEALRESQAHAKAIGNSEMTLDDINAIISESRQERKNAESRT